MLRQSGTEGLIFSRMARPVGSITVRPYHHLLSLVDAPFVVSVVGWVRCRIRRQKRLGLLLKACAGPVPTRAQILPPDLPLAAPVGGPVRPICANFSSLTREAEPA